MVVIRICLGGGGGSYTIDGKTSERTRLSFSMAFKNDRKKSPELLNMRAQICQRVYERGTPWHSLALLGNISTQSLLPSQETWKGEGEAMCSTEVLREIGR